MQKMKCKFKYFDNLIPLGIKEQSMRWFLGVTNEIIQLSPENIEYKISSFDAIVDSKTNRAIVKEEEFLIPSNWRASFVPMEDEYTYDKIVYILKVMMIRLS